MVNLDRKMARKARGCTGVARTPVQLHSSRRCPALLLFVRQNGENIPEGQREMLGMFMKILWVSYSFRRLAEVQ